MVRGTNCTDLPPNLQSRVVNSQHCPAFDEGAASLSAYTITAWESTKGRKQQSPLTQGAAQTVTVRGRWEVTDNSRLLRQGASWT